MTSEPVAPTSPLAAISGGRVLDVATGRGGFIHVLREELRDYDEIVGIDTDATLADGFAEAFGDDPGVRFEAMDALQPSFEDASFDTVAVSDSLHHFAEPRAVLERMHRLLKAGGHFVVSEMYRDGQTDTQATHVELHHWCAAIDRLTGTVHRETYRRRELLALIGALGLGDLRTEDRSDLAADPRDPETIRQLEAVIDRYVANAAGRRDLIAKGEELRSRLHEIGVHGAASILAVGRKRR